jgi:acyl transferase domain-containing protein
LAAAFAEHLPPGTKIPICSVKANIGHTRETAGIAGLIKALLCMHHGTIPAAANFAVPNPEVAWERIPFYVPTAEVAWPRVDGRPRRAGIDSFGIGGLNLHLVLDDRPPEPVPAVSTPGGRVSPHRSIEDENAVAIIGVGAIMPGARTVAAYWDLLVGGQEPTREIPRDRWNADLLLGNGAPLGALIPTRLGGFITDFAYDWKKHKIAPRQLETADPLQFMLLDAADQALRDAGRGSKPFDGRRAAVVVGTVFGGDFARRLNTALRLPEFQATLARVMRELGLPQSSIDEVSAGFAEIFMRSHPSIYDQTGSYTSSTLASRIAKTYDLMGGAFAIDAGEASSLAALGAAAGLISSRACDWVLCAAGQRSMDVSLYEWYALKGVLSSGRPRRAFDSGADGFVPADGVGMLVLKRLSAALRDGDPIRTIIRSVGTGTNPGSAKEALRLGMERALNLSGIEAEAVKIVETVGAGVPSLDSDEAEALAEVYAPASRKDPLLLGSVVDQIGHTQGAAGMASLIKLTLAFQHGKLPAAFTLDRAGSAERSTIALPAGNKLFAAASAFALRGAAYHAILERPAGSRTAEISEAEAWRIVRIGAEDAAGVAARLEAAQKNLEAVFAAAPASAFAAVDRARLAIVVDDCESLSRKLALAHKQIFNRAARGFLDEQGIYYRETSAQPPRLAFVFPGQGSQYGGMLRDLVAQVPAAAAAMREIDETMRRLGFLSFEQIAWNPAAHLAGDVWLAQISVLLADLIVYAAVTAAGVKPDIVTAHSYGEYAALVAAGSWTLDQAIRVTRARCVAVEASPLANGAMLSTTAPLDMLEGFIGSGDVYIANYNALDQTVIGGNKETVARLSERLGAEGFETRLLPVPRPFHTPLMAEVREPMRRVLQEAKLLPPRLPFLSSVANRYVAEPADIRTNLVEQLTEPVRYIDLVGRLVNEGVTLFVEVGPKQVLTGLHRRLIGDEAAAIACDNPKRPGIEQLCRVRALLECAGALNIGARPGSAEARSAAPERAPAKHPIVHFDATAKRRERLLRSAERKPEPATGAPKNENASDELESFLVGFVCEQTGYPPEVVDLDADLEADLGIDSIKKARLLGELRERFDISVKTAGPLSLDDFPTLRHILEFIRQSAAQTETITAAPLRQSQVTIEASAALDSKPTERAQSPLVTVTLSGTPYEMGVQHARSEGNRIKTILQRYNELLPTKLDDVPDLREALGHGELFFTPAGLEELRGLAEELGKPVEHLMAYNLGLYPRQMSGCAQFAITARANGAAGMIHGANEDSPLSLSLTGCLTRIVQLRRPSKGIPHAIFSVSGQFGGLNGLNAHGLSVTSTMLLDRHTGGATPPGRTNPVLVKAILERAEDVDQAIEIVRGAPRAGAWSLCLSHYPTDRLCYVEYDGDSLEVQEVSDAIESTNHCFAHPALQPVPEHSLHRLDRLKNLLTPNGTKRYSVEQARAALRDRYDLGRKRATLHPTMNTIKRLDNQISLVMQPAAAKIWATPGPMANGDADHYYALDVSELFDLSRPSENGRAGASPPNGSSNTEDTPVDDGRIMSRFVLRMAEAPLALSGPEIPNLHGPAVILGDNPSAQALKELLQNNGGVARHLPVTDDPGETLSALERAWREAPAPHLFIMTACDPDAAPGDNEHAWNGRRRRGVMLPYLVCQRWIQLLSESNLISQATLAAATELGGDFGFSGGARAVEGGALTGMMKAIRREFGELAVKVVDLPPEEPPQNVAACLCRELARGNSEVEVGYVRGRRRVVRAVPRPATPLENVAMTRGGSWVITGGARGITAVVARALGERFGLKLHLIGKTPLSGLNGDQTAAGGAKTVEIRKTLRELAAAGVRAHYHSCDVSHRKALAQVLDEIRRCDGPVRGIIHGAGVEEASRFERKQAGKVSATIAAKVDGAAALIALTREDPLEYFVAFGSISGRFGGHGQTDYSLASDMLCKLVSLVRTERPECAAVTIHWPPWDEVGMAVRPETKVVLEAVRQRFMPPTEGVLHLIDELSAGAPEAEVLLIDRTERLDLDKTAPSLPQRGAYLRRKQIILDSPLIEGICELDEGKSLIAEARFDPTSDWFLTEHRLRGTPLLPGAAAVETLAEAASILLPDRKVVGLRDVEILNGLRFFSDRIQRGRIRAKTTDGGVECELRADFYNRDGRLMDPDRLYTKGTVELAEKPSPTRLLRLREPAQWHPLDYADLPNTLESGRMYLGPSLQCVRDLAFEKSRAWGRLVAPPSHEPAPAGVLPWSFLDGCFQVVGSFMHVLREKIQLPQAIERLWLGRRPGDEEVCIVELQWKGREARCNVFDFTLAGADGEVILQAEGYRTIEVGPRSR